MPFTVVWTPAAEIRLTQLYNDAPRTLRGDFARASDRIEAHLKYSGNHYAAPLPDTPGGWIYAEPVGAEYQLALVFDFVPDDMLVTVHKPFLIRKPKSNRL